MSKGWLEKNLENPNFRKEFEEELEKAKKEAEEPCKICKEEGDCNLEIAH